MNTRRPGATVVDTLRILVAMGFGAGMAGFVLWPMALLVARSSRFLPMGPVLDDVVFPYWRLAAMVLPWRDGWPRDVLRPPSPVQLTDARIIFWETVCYVGILPLVAVLWSAARCVLKRKMPGRTWAFIALLGVGGMLLAFPPVHDAFARLPGTVMRSPARLLYLTGFALAFAFGAAIDRLLTLGNGRVWAAVVVAILLGVQVIDLGRHDRCFIRTVYVQPFGPEDQQLKQLVGDGRASIDHQLLSGINREVDDVGFYDSIALAKPYVGLVEIGNLSLEENILSFDGTMLTPRALRLSGVRVVLAPANSFVRQSAATAGNKTIRKMILSGSANRVEFFPLDKTKTTDLDTLHRDLRDQDFDLLHTLLIPTGSARPASAAVPQSLPASVQYSRDSEDQMSISAIAPQSGYLRIDEAWDPGWHATVDGTPVVLIAGDDLFLTLPLEAGYHRVELRFSTPGAVAGLLMSAASLIALFAVTSDRWAGRVPNAQRRKQK
jgi:hypothetical protein